MSGRDQAEARLGPGLSEFGARAAGDAIDRLPVGVYCEAGNHSSCSSWAPDDNGDPIKCRCSCHAQPARGRGLMPVGRHAERRTHRRFKAWQAARPGSLERDAAKQLHDEADALMRRIWALEGPDPVLAGVKAELDRAAARDSDPNPDDPDD